MILMFIIGNIIGFIIGMLIIGLTSSTARTEQAERIRELEQQINMLTHDIK